MIVNKKLLLFISLITIFSFANGQSLEKDENPINKRITLFGQQLSNPFSSAAPPAPAPGTLPFPQINLLAGTPSALPNYFTENDKYSSNNDLLQILTLFTSKLNVETIVGELFQNEPNVETCLACNIIIQHMIAEYKGDEAGFKKFFFTVCELIKVNGEDNGEFCTGFTEIYSPQLFYILDNTKLNPEEVCASLLTECLDHYHWYNQPLFWEINLSQKPQLAYNNNTSKIKEFMVPRDEKEESKKNEESEENKDNGNEDNSQTDKRSPLFNYNINPNHNAQKNYKPPFEETFEGSTFLHLSDIHIDLLYSLHSNSYCGGILCCRLPDKNYVPPAATKLRTAVNPSPTYYANMYNQNQTLPIQGVDLKRPAGFWGSYGNCDMPIRTIKHLLRHVSKFVDQVDYVIFSGDSISHNIWSTNKQQVIETNAILTKLIQKYLLSPISSIRIDEYGNQFGDVTFLPPRKFIPVVGNHESDVVSLFPSTSLQNSKFSITWLYEELYQQWKQWIPADQVVNFKRGGYYSVLVAKNMKLIVLNTNTCYRLNFWLLVFNHDLDGQLAWLESELSLAERTGITNVHLIGHISPDTQNCNAMWLHNFIRIITRYQGIIKAQFYGHSHLDEVKIYYGNSLVEKTIVSRSELDEMHQQQHDEESAKAIIDEVKDENMPKSKRVVNLLAEKQIQQLINLQNLHQRLQHLNKNLVLKKRIGVNDKINGYYTNPNYPREVKKPISVAFLAPSVSSYDDVNPAYKVYIIDEYGYVANGKTYYSNLEEANTIHIQNNYKPPQRRGIGNSLMNNLENEDYPEDDDEDESENQLSYSYALPEESENQLSYSYAPPDKNMYSPYTPAYAPKPVYSNNINYPSYKSNGNDYNQDQTKVYSKQATTPPSNAYPSYPKQGQTYQSSYNSPNSTNYVSKPIDQSNYKKPKTYSESSSPSNYPVNNYAMSSQPSYEQPTKSNSYSSSNYLPPQERKSQYSKPVAKKYPSNQNSYQAKPFEVADKKQSYAQPKSDYGANSIQSYKQQSSFTKPNQNSYKTPSNNYQKPEYQKHANPQPQYSPYQTTEQLPNYSDYLNSMKYAQANADSYHPTNDLPADIDYDFKHYDSDFNDYPSVVDQKNSYQPTASKNKQAYPNYQHNVQPVQKKPNYPPVSKPAQQNYPQKNYSPPIYGNKTSTYQIQPVYQTSKPQPLYPEVAQQKYQPKLAEYKPAEYKPAEYKPAEYKPAEYKPAEYKPAEYKPQEHKPHEYKPHEYKPQEYKPSNYKPNPAPKAYSEKPSINTYNKPTEYKNVASPTYNKQPAPQEQKQPMKTYNSKPADYKPSEYKPQEYKPQEYKPIEHKPVEYKPSSNYKPNLAPQTYTEKPVVNTYNSKPIEYKPVPKAYNQQQPPQEHKPVAYQPSYPLAPSSSNYTVAPNKPPTYSPPIKPNYPSHTQPSMSAYSNLAASNYNQQTQPSKEPVSTYSKPIEYKPAASPTYNQKPQSYEQKQPVNNYIDKPVEYKPAVKPIYNQYPPQEKKQPVSTYSKPTSPEYKSQEYKPIEHKTVEYKPSSSYKPNLVPQTYAEKPPVNTYNSKPVEYKPVPTTTYNQQPPPLQEHKPVAYQPSYAPVPSLNYTAKPMNPNSYPPPIKPQSMPTYANYTKPAPKASYAPVAAEKQTYQKQPIAYKPAPKPTHPTTNYPKQTGYNMNYNHPPKYVAPSAPVAPPPNYEYLQYAWANENYKPPPPSLENVLNNPEYEQRMLRMKKEKSELKWLLGYDINTEYSIAKSTAYDWANFVNLLRTNNELFEKYYRNLHRRSSAERWKVVCNSMCRQVLLDNIIVIDPLDY